MFKKLRKGKLSMKFFLVAIYILGNMFCFNNAIFAQGQQETITITTYYPAPYGSYRVLGTQYIQMGFHTSRYDYIRISKSQDAGDPTSSGNRVAGFMWNNNAPNYGDGDDFVIFTYNGRDIVLRPSGSGNVYVGSRFNPTDLRVYGNVYSHQERGGCIIMSYGENSWTTTCPEGFQIDCDISPPPNSEGGIFYCCREK